MFNPKTFKMLVSRDVVFFENKIVEHKNLISNVNDENNNLLINMERWSRIESSEEAIRLIRVQMYKI